MAVSVVIPWSPGCPYRETALRWLLRYYGEQHPTWQVVVSEASGERWIKAEAVRSGVAEADAEIIILADADCVTDGLPEAVRAVELGASWAKPHGTVYRLTAESSRAFMAGEPWTELDQQPYRGVAGGGFVVARRETLLEIPMDPRFVGWGQEDIAWAMALHCLAGPAWLGDADLIHLWHPPQPRLSRMWGSTDSKRLLKRYSAAKNDPVRMRSLIEEIHAYESSESSLHDRESVVWWA